MQSIRRVVKGKAREWFKNNTAEIKTWRKFQRGFKERFFGIMDEDDLWDEPRCRMHERDESISDYVDAFLHLASRMRNPPPLSAQLGIAVKNILPAYRQHMGGRRPSSFRELLEMSREFERGKKLDERYSYLVRKKSERIAEIQEGQAQKSS